MNLDDIKEKYRGAPVWARLTAAAVLGLMPAIWIYMEDSELLATTLQDSQSREVAERAKFEAALGLKSNVPKLEEQLAFTEEQMVKAKKSLPDSYRIEDILERAATLAKESGVRLVTFKPGAEVFNRSPSQYVELPIATEIEGKFGQIAAFLDRVVHLESSIFVRKLDMVRVENVSDAAPSPATTTAYQTAVRSRQQTAVTAKFDLAIYRAMTDAEALGAEGNVPATPPATPPPAPAPAPGGGG